jgi:hypothetical protein
MTYVDIRNQAVEKIRAAFPPSARIHIAAHPGRFSEAEVKRLANQTPAILTSLVRCQDGDVNSVTFVSWVLCRATSQDKLYDGALQIVSALVPVIRGMDFDLMLKGDPNIEAECLYTGALDAINITLWAVKWELLFVDNAFNAEGKTLAEALAALENFEGYDSTTLVGTEDVRDQVNLED